MVKSYAVGYGKPPKSARFKPGQSGNPKGRPKGAQNLTTVVSRELKKVIRVREGDRELQINKQAAWVMATFNRALKHGGRDSEVILRLIDRLESMSLGSDPRALTTDENEVLKAYTARLRRDWEQEKPATPEATPVYVNSKPLGET